jgi:hypothetical protein
MPEVDVILDVLKASVAAFPASPFLQSLYEQYLDRGFLTKKQLEGLHSKASKHADMPVGKLATLAAIILKLPERQKSLPHFPKPMYTKDPVIERMLADILYKKPEHKAVLNYQLKFDKNEPLTAFELAELKRFHKLFG